MSKINVEIWSDIACPYCYIGKRKFEQALTRFAQASDVEIIWHSYELNPSLPKGNNNGSWVDYVKKLTGGSTESVNAKAAGLTQLAKEVGLDYHLDKTIITNTSDALRLVKLAKETGKADAAEEMLFKAYFVDGKDISDRAFLLETAEHLGITRTDAEALLDSEKYRDEIAEDIDFSENQLSLEYIPFYRINNRITIEGSLAVDEYVNALEAAVAGDDANFSGQSCSIDGVCS